MAASHEAPTNTKDIQNLAAELHALLDLASLGVINRPEDLNLTQAHLQSGRSPFTVEHAMALGNPGNFDDFVANLRVALQTNAVLPSVALQAYLERKKTQPGRLATLTQGLLSLIKRA